MNTEMAKIFVFFHLVMHRDSTEFGKTVGKI